PLPTGLRIPIRVSFQTCVDLLPKDISLGTALFDIAQDISLQMHPRRAILTLDTHFFDDGSHVV
ncbi:MAG TPA: hypothetical protein VE087_01930, partial [Xanthobacteraceae bacterium]|nr:hypothetical protein [Xanthobacteraceae bacterium]